MFHLQKKASNLSQISRSISLLARQSCCANAKENGILSQIPNMQAVQLIQKKGFANFLEGQADYQHFKASGVPHPLKAKSAYETDELLEGDHTGRQQNHIWTKAELDYLLKNIHRYKPQNVMDKVVQSIMYGLYHTFNFVTGYKDENPSVKAIEWRLIVLESVAGVPGFVAAGFRHFRSLRTMKRDHGWIATLLEEAENERMHLLICLRMFDASFATRFMVVSAQLSLTPLLMTVYAIHPPAMHRFVGYLEETACHTYANIIKHIDTPGTNLNKEWAELKAPAVARGYWKLPEDAKWVDTLKCMFADECHHRDVNHTLANMKTDDPNPFVMEHKENAIRAWHIAQAEAGANK